MRPFERRPASLELMLAIAAATPYVG